MMEPFELLKEMLKKSVAIGRLSRQLAFNEGKFKLEEGESWNR